MFLRFRSGADLVPGILVAVAIAGIGLAFVGRFYLGIGEMGTHAGNTVNAMENGYINAAGQAANEIR